MDELLKEFVAETRETLQAIAGEIVAWEADPGDRVRLDAIFRFVHTVKGSCGFLDLPRLARLSHAAEDALAAVRAGERVADAALVSAVLAIVDRIGELVEAIDAGVALDDSSEDLLIAALDAPAAPGGAGVVAMPQAAVQRAPVRSVRLSVDLLDRMMSGVSDLVLARNELARRLRDTGDATLEPVIDRLSLTVADLRDTVTRTRMQSIDALFSALPRVVRDTAAQLGKQVALTIDGGDVELDREMIELLRDPLVHMVRNAIDHGIESPVMRRAAGKPEAGRLRVAARQSGNRIIVEIADDGAGIDTARLVEKVIAQNPARAAAVRGMNEAGRASLVFEPGLSSRDSVSEISGRGVGMDVVRANVEQIGGRIALANTPGRGLSVAIEVPLTLAIISAIVVESGGLRLAVPRGAVDEIVAADAGIVRIDRLGDAPVVAVRDRRMPLVRLDRVLAREAGAAARIVVVDVPGGSYALQVDAIVDTDELVVKPAAPAVMAAGIYAGQALPDDGRPLLLLDCAGVATAAELAFGREVRSEEAVVEVPAPAGLAALLFDDLDGHRRAIALAAVDRIDTVPAAAVRQAGGRWWLALDEGLVPLACAAGFTPPARALQVLRIHDDRRAIAYPIAAASDIVTLPDSLAPAHGELAGIALFEGEAIELLDPLRLLEQVGVPDVAAKPICLLHGVESGWMAAFLAPSIEAAGYRVARRLGAGETAAVTLAMDDDAGVEGAVIRLSRAPDGDLYRYDRAGVQAALARGMAQ